MNASQRKELRENIVAGFEIFKWVWAGVAAVVIGAGVTMYNMKMESIELRKDLESEQRTNIQQERKIDETYKLMRDIAREQARMAEAMESLSRNVTSAMHRVAKDTSEIRNRVDRHIEAGNG